jgi:serine/threonine protein kinase
MGAEHVPGMAFQPGEKIKGYEILKAFDPGGFAFAGKAKAPSGRPVFFKKYKKPGGMSPWLDGFIAYQAELKNRIQIAPNARNLCYEFIEFFEMRLDGGAVPKRAYYQVFEWVEGGKDLRIVVDELKASPAAYDWRQRDIFSRVMLAGVNAIHQEAGVIHTDLKPENFYLLPAPETTAKWKVRVIDMDFSILDGQTAPWDGHEGYVGTPGYMSPEHLAKKVPQKASDVFTCALMLGELIGGGHPAGESFDDYEDKVTNGRLAPVEIQHPLEKTPDLKFVNHVINGCLRLEAPKRPTVMQVLQALNGVLPEWDGLRPGSGTKISPPAPPKKETAPVIVKQPAEASVKVGQSVSISVEANGTDLCFQWRKNGFPVPSGAAARLDIRSAQVADSGHYDVSITNAGGTVLSHRAELKVTSAPVPTPAPPPALSAKGINLTGPNGKVLESRISSKFGGAALKSFGAEFGKYLSNEQFYLYKADERWFVEHCQGAINPTKVNGNVLTAPIAVTNGMVITVGKTGVCPVTLHLG